MSRNFASAYPDTPESFHIALENTCKELERLNASTHRHIRRTAWVAALLAALLLAGLAYAATQSSLLETLFRGRTPNQEAQELLEPIGQSVTKEGITLTLGDYLVDGDEWYLSYSVESARDDTVLCSAALGSSLAPERPLIDDAGHHMLNVLGGSVDGAPMPGIFTETSDPWGREWDGRLRDRQPFEVTILLRVAKPKMQLVLWPKEDQMPGDYGIKEGEWAALKRNKQLPVYRHGISPFPQSLKDIDRASEVGIMQVCEDAGTVEPLTELRLSVTIDPAKGGRVIHASLAAPQRFEFADYALQVDMVDLTPTASVVDFRVLPNAWLDESGLTKAEYLDTFGRDYALLNENGQNLGGEELGALFNGAEQLLINEKYAPYGVSWALSELPDVLVLAPIIWGEGEWPEREIRGYDMQQAVRLSLDKKVPDFTAVDQPLPDIGPVMQAFFGTDAQKMQPVEPAQEGCVSYESSDGALRIDWNRQTGFFYLSKPGAVPTARRGVGQTDGAQGKYTQEEALELARRFLSDEIGIDTALLSAGDVYPEDPRAQRSRAYRIMFGYSHDGIHLRSRGLSSVQLKVTDEGVVFACGGALGIEP